jgi:hypothetical protein
MSSQLANGVLRLNLPATAQGFWTKLGREDAVYDGVYEHIEQERYVAADGKVKFRDKPRGIKSTTQAGVVTRNRAVEVNKVRNIGRKPDGTPILDNGGNPVYTYVWVKVGHQKSVNDAEFLFDHANKDKFTSPTFAYFRVLHDRKPDEPTMLVEFESKFPDKNEAPLSRDPDTGQLLQDPQTGEYMECEPGDVFEVTDDLYFFPKAVVGDGSAYGIAVYDDTYETWDVVQCMQMCLMATARLVDPPGSSPGDPTSLGMNGTDEQAYFEDFNPVPFSTFNQYPDPAPESARNRSRHMGRAGDLIHIVWDNTLEEWEVIDVQRHSIKHIYDIRLNGTTKLQVKQLDSAVETNITESNGDWTDKIDLTTCSS